MADELVLEAAPGQNPRPRFWKTRSGILAIVFLLLAILAGLFSWWLAQGKISSASGRLDTIIYTVGAQFDVPMENVYVKPGDIVAPGQPLGRMDVAALEKQLTGEGMELANLRRAPGMASIAERLGRAQAAEKDMAARANQARATEDTYRLAMQERVTEHVRAQLAMRSINPANRGAYSRAQGVEQAARARMEAARDEYEKVSRARAAVDKELAGIRAEIMRARQQGGLPARQQPGQTRHLDINPDLLAPIAGRVIRVSAMRGQLARRDQPLFLIQPTGTRGQTDAWIQAWFTLKDRKLLEIGQPVSIRFENKGLHVNGKVIAIGDEAESINTPGGQTMNAYVGDDSAKFNSANYVPVRIVADDPSEIKNIEPGAKVDCQIQTRYVPGLNFL